MNHYMKFLFSMVLAFFMLGAYAQNETTLADIKGNVITSLQKDGYLSEKMANEVTGKYISEKDIQTKVYTVGAETKSGAIQEDVVEDKTTFNWSQYLSWINFVKVIGIIFILVAFWGFIMRIMVTCWFIIAAVPVIVYQVIFLCSSLVGLIIPEKVWESQSFYVALFCAFTTLMVIAWMVETHDKLKNFIKKFSLGISPNIVISFWLMVYFATLAIVYQSTIFGFFAAIALSGVFTFGLVYMPGVLFLTFKENALSSMVIGHIAVLAGYVAIYHMGIANPYLQYFNAGIQYYCSVALGVGLLVGASPFYKESHIPGYFVLALLVAVASSILYFFLGMTTIATVMFIFLALIFIEWVGYIGFQGGWVIGFGVSGAILYGLSMIFEKYGAIILHNMKTVLS